MSKLDKATYLNYNMEFSHLGQLVREANEISEVKKLQRELDALCREAGHYCKIEDLEKMFDEVHFLIVNRFIDLYEKEITEYEKRLSEENLDEQ